MRGTPRRRVLVLTALFLTLFAGCIDGEDGAEPPRPLESLVVYQYRYGGDDVALPGVVHGWMARLTNRADTPVTFIVRPLDPATLYGPAGNTSWETFAAPTRDLLEPGASKVYLFQRTWQDAPGHAGLAVDVLEGTPVDADADLAAARVLEHGRFERAVSWLPTVVPVTAGQHVRTATVGIWLNGTSFYTNIEDLYRDAAFPYPAAARNASDPAPLPVYVYDVDASEQPPGSADSCHFPTIRGYNALLKTQAERGTNVRWLAPEEAYTRPDRRDHWLYGEVLVFLDTIVVHDGTVTPEEQAPNPLGECFDAQNTSPVPLPAVPPAPA